MTYEEIQQTGDPRFAKRTAKVLQTTVCREKKRRANGGLTRH